MITRSESSRQQIAGIAAEMVAERLDLLEGCRAIVRLRGTLTGPDLSDPDLLVLAAVESELDDVPSGVARQQWEPKALAEKDRQKNEYLAAARPEIRRACDALIKRWK